MTDGLDIAEMLNSPENWHADIRRCAIGYEATYRDDGLMALSGGTWRFTRRGVERAARRTLRRLNRPPATTYRIGPDA